MISNPALPLGSLVLVTASNGLISSHICDQFVKAGYKVRGTVRSAEKNAWMPAYFERTYGPGEFELLEAPDFSGSFWTEALKNCAALVHTASNITFDPNPNNVIPGDLQDVKNAAEACAANSAIKRFTLLSSSTTVTTPEGNVKRHLRTWDFNDEAVKLAWEEPFEGDFKGMLVYMADKVTCEKWMWEFMKKRKPGFVFNTVLPDTVLGGSIDQEGQGLRSTASWVMDFFHGNQSMMKVWSTICPPQHCVSARDIGRLTVISVANPSVKGERLYGYSEPYNWNRILAFFRKTFPEREFPEDNPDLGRELMTFEGRERAKELLIEWGNPNGFMTFEEMMTENVAHVR